MASRLKCVHVTNLADVTHSDIENARDAGKCSECHISGPNLWLCLYRGCHKIGCGEAHNDHSTAHNRIIPSHCIHLNLSTQRVWCYRCEKEVFVDCVDPARVSPQPSQSTQSPQSRTVRYGPQSAGDSGDSSDSEGSRDDNDKPRGLTGLQNIGNTCYMNSALQALSNTPPLTQFFLECGPALVAPQRHDKKPALSRLYHRLMQEMWHRRRPGYVVPSGVLYGIRNVHPMFRGYQQHDTQEFLRCFMDQLHEELKEPIVEIPNKKRGHHFSPTPGGGSGCVEDSSDDEGGGGGVSSQSDEGEEYETCDSGVSERSSLSEEGDRVRSTAKRKLSRSPSPPHDRARTKLISPGGSLTRAGCGQGAGGAGGRPGRKKHHAVKHRSIISDVFDGKLLSSVQCLTCDRVSTRVETFQDLSLPIPSRDHIHMIHQGSLTPQKGSLSACSEVYVGDQGWVNWLWEWFRSWFWGPTVSLHDCLAAFFSADELKGDNMYSCEKCNKLRNGVKYSKVLELPEVLCIHLKRFRNEVMFSAKINSFVTFPLVGLDMRPYMHKDCVSTVTSYDLVSVICHHGTAGGGHYTCYSFNAVTERWFEFDDQFVTQVMPETVQGCEAYVLFYQKSHDHISKLRSRAIELIELSHSEPPSLMQFYVSKQWVNKFNTFAEPGPIDNSDFLCVHGGVLASKVGVVNQLCTVLSQSVWEYLYDNFGGGPACNCLYECTVCSEQQLALARRIKQELEVFVRLNKEFQAEDNPAVIYAIAMSWFRQWQHFVQAKEECTEPPGPIDNTSIATNKGGQPALKAGSDYAQLSEELWQFFHRVYGGGPELALRTPAAPSLPRATPAPSPAPAPRPAPLAHTLRSHSTENIYYNVAGHTGRTVRAQSFSDNVNARSAARSGPRRLPDATSDQCLALISRINHDRPLTRSADDLTTLTDPPRQSDPPTRARSEEDLRFSEPDRAQPGTAGREGDPNRFTPSSLENLYQDVAAGVGRGGKKNRPRDSSLGPDNRHTSIASN